MDFRWFYCFVRLVVADRPSRLGHGGGGGLSVLLPLARGLTMMNWLVRFGFVFMASGLLLMSGGD